MKIWVDADVCPKPIKDIVLRAAAAARVVTTSVSRQVDDAVQRILDEVQGGDLVITADVSLAAAVVARGAQALDPRGTLYTADNVRERLLMREITQALRAGGEVVRELAPFRMSDRHLFANQLDRFLARSRAA